MEYEDFGLRIRHEAASDSDKPYRVEARWRSSFAHVPIDSPHELPAFRGGLQTLDAVRGAGESTVGFAAALAAGAGPAADDPTVLRQAAQGFGGDLFRTLFTGEVGTLFRRGLDEVRAGGKGLRVRLRFDDLAPELATLPWELLYDAEPPARGYLSRSPETPLVRHLELSSAAEPLAVTPPLRVLAMAAGPTDLPALDIAGEKAFLEEAFHDLNRDTPYVELHWVPGSTWRDLAAAIREGTWHVFHFIGHGGFDGGEGHLLLCDDEGRAVAKRGVDLAELLRREPALRLVVLNACEGARASDGELLSGLGATLTGAGIEAVVSMQYPITDEGAKAFSRSFYRHLIDGRAVDEALSEARFDMRHELGDPVEWATPVLHLRSPDGRLFDLLAGALFQQRPRAVLATEPRTHLIAKVREHWLDGVLIQALPQGLLMAPGMEPVRAAPRAARADEDADEPESAPAPASMVAGTDVLSVFERMGRRMLIVGDPYSGKSVRLLELAGALLALAESDPEQPVPVVLQLASWRREMGSLDGWLLAELNAGYGMPAHLGQRFLARANMVLLLDGLDEIHRDDRPACIAAINAFMQKTESGGVALACRLRVYLELPVELAVEGAVRMLPLERRQVRAYVERAGAAFAPLREVLAASPALLDQARSPLVLGAMLDAFGGRPRAEIEAEIARLGEHREGLIAAFADRRLGGARFGAGAAGPESASPQEEDAGAAEDLRRTLSWLARGMRARRQAVFLVERLQPSWLPRPWQRAGYLVLLSLVFGLLAGATLAIASTISLKIDPPREPSRYAVKHAYWLILSPLWLVLVGTLDIHFPRWLPSRLLARSWTPGWRTVLDGLIYYAIWMALWFSVWVALVRPGASGSGPSWLVFPATFGVAFVALFAAQATTRGVALENSIRTVEVLGWSWRRAWLGLIPGVVGGAAVWVVSAVTKTLHGGSLGESLPTLVLDGAIGALLGFLFLGVRMQMLERTSKPNQGIWLSLANGALIALLAFPLHAAVLWPVLQLRFFVLAEAPKGLTETTVALATLGIAGIAAGAAFLWFGGLDFIGHWILRAVLAWRGPSDLVRRLEEARARGFLHRAGGGYLFANRLLLERFAAEPGRKP